MDTAKQSYRNLCLSYRGSERQPPNSLQLALRFSQIIEMRDKQGVHNKLWTPEQRLQEVVDEFNETSGLQQKHRVDAERFRSLLNLISGSCEATWLDITTCKWLHLRLVVSSCSQGVPASPSAAPEPPQVAGERLQRGAIQG